LIMLENGNGSCILAVSAVTATTITFTTSDTTNDPLPFNQFPLNASSPTAGTIGNLQTLSGAGNSYGVATYAYQLTMTTYYLDNATRPGYWMLMKQMGTGAPMTGTPAVQSNAPQPVALGINVLQFAFSCNTAANCSATSLDPTRAPTDPSDIRMVNLWLTAIANHPNRKTGTYFTNSIGTTVTDQNLAYSKEY